jgi:hypothetical protein
VDQQQQLKIQAMYQIVSNLLNTVLSNDPPSVMRLQQAQQCIMINDTQNASNIVQVFYGLE